MEIKSIDEGGFSCLHQESADRSLRMEWGAFSEEWLVEHILNTKTPNLTHRGFNKMPIGIIKRHWLKIVELYQE